MDFQIFFGKNLERKNKFFLKMQQDHTQAHACLSRVLVLARQTHHPQEEDENTSVHDFLKYVFSFPHQRIIGTSKFGIMKIRKNWEFSTTLRTWLFATLTLIKSSTSSLSSRQQSFCLDRRDYQHIFFSLVFGNFQHLAVSFSVSFGMFWRDAHAAAVHSTAFSNKCGSSRVISKS